MFPSNSERWQAVQSRCPAATSAFVYAVLTTQIFCRPTCPARLARKANVRFYDTASAALRAGFRPCKRCKPEQTVGNSVATEAVGRARTFIENRAGNVTLAEVAKEVGLSARYLHGLFKNLSGITPSAYASRCRENLKIEPQHAQSASSLRYKTDLRKSEDGGIFVSNLSSDQANPGTLPDHTAWFGPAEDFTACSDPELDFSYLLELTSASRGYVEPGTSSSLDSISVTDPIFAQLGTGDDENGWLGMPFHPGSDLSIQSLSSNSSRNSSLPGMPQEDFLDDDRELLDLSSSYTEVAWDMLGQGAAITSANPNQAERYKQVKNAEFC